MATKKKVPRAKNPAAQALIDLRWSRVSESEKLKIGRKLTEDRIRLRKERAKQKPKRK